MASHYSEEHLTLGSEKILDLVDEEIELALSCLKSEEPYKNYFITEVYDIEHKPLKTVAKAKGYIIISKR